MPSGLVQTLRKAKRRMFCFDRAIRLERRPRLIGYTDGGSPRFDWSVPIGVRIRAGAWDELLLRLTFSREGRLQEGFCPTIEVCGERAVSTVPVRCCTTWDAVWVPLGPLGRAGEPLRLELSIAGPEVERAALGELRLVRHPDDRRRPVKRGVQCLTFPRSGHHLLMDIVEPYFGPDFHYCGYYHCCRARPCAEPANSIQKLHDHGLEVPLTPDLDYMVQCRNPLFSLASLYELYQRRGRITDRPDTLDTWRQFAVEEIHHWRRWVRRWVLQNDHPRCLVVTYEGMLADPVGCARRVLEFLAPGCAVDERCLHRVIRRQHVRQCRRLESFRHFQREFFEELESSSAEEIDAIGLPRAMRDGS